MYPLRNTKNGAYHVRVRLPIAWYSSSSNSYTASRNPCSTPTETHACTQMHSWTSPAVQPALRYQAVAQAQMYCRSHLAYCEASPSGCLMGSSALPLKLEMLGVNLQRR